MDRRRFILFGTAGSVAVLTGCGGSGGGAAEAPTPSMGPAPPPASPPASNPPPPAARQRNAPRSGQRPTQPRARQRLVRWTRSPRPWPRAGYRRPSAALSARTIQRTPRDQLPRAGRRNRGPKCPARGQTRSGAVPRIATGVPLPPDPRSTPPPQSLSGGPLLAAARELTFAARVRQKTSANVRQACHPCGTSGRY